MRIILQEKETIFPPRQTRLYVRDMQRICRGPESRQAVQEGCLVGAGTNAASSAFAS